MRIIKFIGLLSITLLLSCTGSKPETTVKDFFEAISNKDFDKAKELSTERTHTVINLLENGLDVSFGNKKLKNVDCLNENEINTCDCFFEGVEKPIPVSLIKENSEWKVDYQMSLKNSINDFLNNFNLDGINLSGIDLSGIDLENIDVEGIMESLGGTVETGTNKINEFLKTVDADKISETLKGLDSNMGETSGNLEKLLQDIKQGMGETVD